jgi:hypothetical protein
MIYFLRINKLCRRDVLLFVRVLCPRTGNPFRCLLPLTELISIKRLIFKLIKRFKSPSSLNSSVSNKSRNAEIFASFKSETLISGSIFNLFNIFLEVSIPIP